MTFEQAVEFVLSREGVYSNDLEDRGGETAYGISHRQYPDIDLKKLTKADAARLYKTDYWDPLHCDELPHGLDLLVFDAGVNQGQLKAARMLQKTLGVALDGIVGPETVKAAQLYPSKTIVGFATERMIAYGRNVQFERYGNGWSRRLMSAVYVALGAHQ